MSKKDSTKKRDKKTEKYASIFDRIRDVHIQIVLVIATWILVFITYCQYRAGIDSIQTTTRAYLRPDARFEERVRMSDNKIHIRITVIPKNYGQSPADHVQTIAYLILADSSYAIRQTGGDTLKYGIRSGFNGLELEYEESPFPRDFQVEHRILTLYLNGRITYNDIFKEKHITEFCLRLHWGERKYFKEYGDCNYAN